MSVHEKDIGTARLIAEKVSDNGGRAYYVGGYVRDKLRNIENKDIDIEVHGIEPPLLEGILDGIGKRIEIGESFGIYSLRGHNIDIALPRKEKSFGCGHRDFSVTADPFIGTYEAAKRRDFTVNAIMQDILTGDITDHFGGAEDLKSGVLRHVDANTFPEDPLRVLRAAQFAARFEFAVADETAALCSAIPLDGLSKERIEGELKKALLKSQKPSVFFETLRKMNKLSPWFEEVEALIGTPQNINYHKEGDVWTHTMMVLDAAADFRDKTAEPFAFMLSALAHDLGKPKSTTVADGVTHSYGHESLGLEPAERLVKRISGEKMLRRYVLNMVQNHMKPNVYARNDAPAKKTNKLFDGSVSPRDLIYLALSDGMGKIPRADTAAAEKYLFEKLSVYEQIMSAPHVTGEDLIKAGLLPNEDFSELLGYAHKLRLAGIEKEQALKQTLSLARKLAKKPK